MEKESKRHTGMNRLDIAVILLALLLLLFALGVLFSPKMYNFVWGNGASSDAPIVGDLILKENKVLHRSESSFSWSDAFNKQKIRQGDTLFTGKNSTSVVELNGGSELSLSANSLVVFNEFDGSAIPDINFGNFRLKANKDFEISINGQVTKVKASKSEIEIQLTEGERPKIKVLSGEAQFAKKSDDIFVNADEFTGLPITYDPLPDEGLQVFDSKVIPNDIGETQYTYMYKVCDLYTCNTKNMSRRQQIQKVDQAHLIEWSKSNDAPTFIEHSQNEDFLISDKNEVPGYFNSHKVDESYIGPNYYRLSSDQQTWSDTMKYHVSAKTVDIAPPKISVNKKRVYIKEDKGQISYTLQGNVGFKDYLVEVYNYDNYQKKLILVGKTASLTNSFSFKKPGLYAVRARGIDFNEQLSALGPAIGIEVEQQRPKPKPKPIAKRKNRKEKSQREVASIDNSLKEAWENVKKKINRRWKESKISLEGAGFAMFSSDQTANNSEAPFALLIALRVEHWLENYGFGGVFRTKTFDLENSEDVKPLNIEARMAKRWFMNWGFFGNNSSQLSLIGALEYNTNGSSSSEFSTDYTLVKGGLGFHFPVFDRLDTGGELLYGRSFDSSQKFEVSGFANYYFKDDFSAGLGYRIHLFEAGSTDSTPSTLPYREGYGEAYSSLKWYY